MAAQAVGVVQGAHGGHEQGLVAADRMQDGGIESQEAEVFLRGGSRGKQVESGIGLHGPVAVLAASVDALEGFLVENHLQVVLLGHLLHHNHEQHVLVHGGGDVREHRSAFKLIGRHFVVPGLQRNAQLVGFCLKVFHEHRHAGGDGAKIMVRQLLVLGRCVANHRATTQLEVRTGIVQGLVHQEILLLQAHIDAYVRHLRLKQPCHGRGSGIQRLDGSEIGHFHVQRLAGIGHKNGRDAQGPVQDEGGRIGVPGRVAAGLEGVTEPSVGEAGRIRLLLHQGAALEVFHGFPVLEGEKGFVFFCGGTGEGLKEVGVMGCTQFCCPGLHAGSNFLCHAPVYLVAGFTGPQDGLEGSVGHIPPHGFQGKYILAEVRRNRPVFHAMSLNIT